MIKSAALAKYVKMSTLGIPSTEVVNAVMEIKTADIINRKNIDKYERPSGEKVLS